MPSVLVRGVTNEELTQMQGAQTFSWASTAVMGGIAGAFASAAIVGAVLRQKRQLLKEPLISGARPGMECCEKIYGQAYMHVFSCRFVL